MKTDFKLLLSKLHENNIDFIIVGGFAAAAYGSSFVTHDLDICSVLTPENIEKLRHGLADVHPIHRIAQNKPSFLDTPKLTEGISNLYLQTDIGVIDILSSITGVGDYNELKKTCIEIKIKAEMIEIRETDFVDPNLTQAETWRLTKENWLKFKG